MKRKPSYSDLKYSIRIMNNGDGTFSVEVPKLPGCYSAGKTKEECMINVFEAIDLHLKGLKKRPPEDPIPAIEVVREVPRTEEHLISLPEACRFLDVSDATMRRYIKSGKVPAYSFGKEYKFKIQELSAFIDSSRIEVKTPKMKRVS